MKHFLLVSHFVPKKGFDYPGAMCPIKHRQFAHEQMYGIDRFFSEPVIWTTVNVEKVSASQLETLMKKSDFDAVFLSGSPYSVNDEEEWIEDVMVALLGLLREKGSLPVVGVCFGAQLLAHCLGGRIEKAEQFYKGEVDMNFSCGTEIMTRVFHEEYIAELPEGTKVHGKGPQEMPYLVEYGNNCWGIQPHFEYRLGCGEQDQAASGMWKQFIDQAFNEDPLKD